MEEEKNEKKREEVLDGEDVASLPDERESLLFGDVIDGDLFPRSRVVRSQFGQIYLQSHFDLLGECARREDGLHLGHDRRRYHTTVGTNGVDFLADSGHDSKVLREIRRQNAGDSVRIHVLQLAHICDWQQNSFFCGLVSRNFPFEIIPVS